MKADRRAAWGVGWGGVRGKGRGSNWYSRSINLYSSKGLRQLLNCLSHNTGTQTRDSALWQTKYPQYKSMKRLCINTYVYTVTSLLCSIRKGRGRWWKRACFQSFRTGKLFYFYYSYFQYLRLHRESSTILWCWLGGAKATDNACQVPMHCSRNSTICSPCELRASRKDNYFCIATNTIFFTDRTLKMLLATQYRFQLDWVCLAIPRNAY